MNVADIRAIFLGYVLQPTNTVASFCMSDDTQVLNLEAQASYPQLQLDPPTIRPEINKARTWRQTFSFEVAIVAPVETDDWAKGRRVIETLEVEMERLLSYLNTIRHDFRNWEIISLGEMVPIQLSQNDSLSGWAVPISLQTNLTCHYNPGMLHRVTVLSPVWTEGETILGLDIDGTQYAATWDDQAMPLSRPLDTLVAAITTDFATHGIHARRDLETLILSHSLAATDIPWTEVAGQHSWTAKTA